MRNLTQITLSLSKKLSVLAVSAVLAACAVGPDYRQPETKSPDEFVSTDPAQFATADVEAESSLAGGANRCFEGSVAAARRSCATHGSCKFPR